MTEDQWDKASRPKIRSFYRDLLEHDKSEGTNVFNEVIQTENYIRETARTKKRMSRANLIWFVASVLFLGGIFVVAYLANVFSDPEPIGQGPELPGMFTVDYNVRLSVDSGINETLAEYAAQNFVSPSIVRLVPEDAKILSFRETAESLWPGVPLLLSTSVRPLFMLGYHTENNTKHAFLVLQMINLPDSIQALRTWEETMLQDLDLAFGIPDSPASTVWESELMLNLPVRSLYRSTTREVTDTIRTPVISNEVVTNPDGTTTTTPVTTYTEEEITTIQPGGRERVFSYAIINGTYIIITDSSRTLDTLINRLAQGS